MSRSDFYKRIINGDRPDKLNDVFVRSVLPEVILELNELQTIQSEEFRNIKIRIENLESNKDNQCNEIRSQTDKLNSAVSRLASDFSIANSATDNKNLSISDDIERIKRQLILAENEIKKLKARKVVMNFACADEVEETESLGGERS